MRTVSAKFAAAITRSHKVSTLAEVLATDGSVTPIAITEGTVTQDQRAAVRGRCDVTVATDLSLVPSGPGSLISPYGNELRVSRGIEYPDGTSERVPLGVFRMQTVDVDDAPDGVQVRISGLDRAQRISDARFEESYQAAVGTSYTNAIRDVLLAVWSEVPMRFTDTAYATPTLVAQQGDDPWAFAQSMATSIGMRLYFDGDGVAVLEPDLNGAQVASISEGAGGVLLSAGRGWTREGTSNRFIVTGENTGETVSARGVATDDNPLSPTYYFGGYGRVPEFYSSPLITTDQQATDAARSMLQKQLGTSEQVQFGSLVLSHLEPGDTVKITRERAKIDELHVVDSLTFPLAADGAMSGQTRARQVT